MSNITSNNAVVAIYKSHAEAEAAVKELQRSGFDIKKLSIVGRDYHTEEHVVGYYTLIGAGLYNLGIPKDSLTSYETALKTGKFVLIVHGTEEETADAREIIGRTNPEVVDHHQPSQTNPHECPVGA
jgi:hypothetical protein